MVLDQSRNNQLNGLARSIADIQKGPGGLTVAVIHSKHFEMLQQFVPELERIFGYSVQLVHLAMLEEIYTWGVDIRWHMHTDPS